jgi:hypothetical protein
MTLDRDLMYDTMRLPCPCCGTPIERTGSAFISAKQMRCPHCGGTFKLGYSQKLELFERVRRARYDADGRNA